MNLAVKCEVCCSKPATHKCKICGRKVCPEDYNSRIGVCSVCESTLCRVCERNLSVATCIICGRPCCEDCLVQVSQLEYICVECVMRSRKSGGDVENG